jgi:DNA-binding transcriptional regulator YbjK
VAKNWRQQIEARKNAWAGELLAEHFSTYCEKRRQHFRSHIERLLADLEMESRPKNKAADVTERIVGQMKEALLGLDLPLANAVASLR